ncbi:hypothetical protein F8M41_010545 [Gigaspora margarita]|uniref:Uncharacterized protein n=1 Tax=Gigaspora margarita TaxID=4874 RepID=A0A8H3X2I6_GIGMA|nr:hypothetical protein F8M41_010545 [Gigaspora margarita]
MTKLTTEKGFRPNKNIEENMNLLQEIIEAQQIFVKRLKAQNNNQEATTKKVKIIHSKSDNKVQESRQASSLQSNKNIILLLQNNTTNKVDNESRTPN